MPTYTLNTPVTLFNHNEYGTRLLFNNGIVNPRDELGKNGVTTHGWFSRIFYKTIRIRAQVIDQNGQSERSIYINKNSLKKYLGAGVDAINNTTELMNVLRSKLWTTDSNHGIEQRAAQIHAGSHGLRHAGRHNQRFVNRWGNALGDYLKGSFLGWLYRKTISGVNRIKVRFLFVGKERGLFEAGEILAKKRFKDAFKEVPAYREHIVRFNGRKIENGEPVLNGEFDVNRQLLVNGKLTANLTFKDIPITTKANYIKHQKFDSDTHVHGKYPIKDKTDTSTGTTGKPTEWVRSHDEVELVKQSLQLAAKIQFGQRRLSYIDAFALGPWATGLTTYELMRNTGSVFATGPDKEKIIDKLLSIQKYEDHQLDLALADFRVTDRRLTPEDREQHEQDLRAIIKDYISDVLKWMLKHRQDSLNDALHACRPINNLAALTILKNHAAKIRTITERLNKEKVQTIIAGYPPFLKDLADYAKNERNCDFSQFSTIGVVGGQAISEAMRDHLIDHGFDAIYSSYGASDIDINLGVEADDEIIIRKAIEANPGLARELYGENKGTPMVFHADTFNTLIECSDEPETKDHLIFTTTRPNRSSPRVRYDLGDEGRVYAASDVQALLAKYGIFHKPKTNLPLIFVWGRESTVVYNGANLAFTELERAVNDLDQNEQILKKAFYTRLDEHGVEQLELWLELKEGIDLPDEHAISDYARELLIKLSGLNQDFKYQLDVLNEGTNLPVVRFFKRGHSPISEAGGHRKQVLVFNKDNLPNDYHLPADDVCCGVSIQKEDGMFNQAMGNRV